MQEYISNKMDAEADIVTAGAVHLRSALGFTPNQRCRGRASARRATANACIGGAKPAPGPAPGDGRQLEG